MTLPNLYLGSTLISPRQLHETMVAASRTSTTNPAVAAVSVSPNATANTKGEWVEVIASTSVAADVIRLIATGTGTSSAGNGALFDVGVGSSGAETVLVANVAVAYHCGPIEIPIAVAAGTRLAVRWQSSRTSAGAATVGIRLLANPANTVRSAATIDTIGADTATSAGVSLAGTSNVWVEVTASTARAYRGVVVCPTSLDGGLAAGNFLAVDVGVGSSGAETAHLASAVYVTQGSETITLTEGSTYMPVDIPAGSRIAARYIENGANNFSVVLLGVPA